MNKIKELDRLFRERQLPLSYSLEDVERFLKETYGAVRVGREEREASFVSLPGEPYRILDLYKIDDPDVLSGLTDEEEKSHHREFQTLYETLPMHPDENKKRAQIQRSIQQGFLLFVSIEGDNNGNLKSFTLHGESRKLVTHLSMFLGIKSGECSLENETYTNYLLLLAECGML
ncbi:hypothetical protein [Paenibacillus chitinolyticus]|uniref:hypothetical protein n=1 Tax=Paenibacillus chitinolyticus TaxID=79263 RepID=UPI001C48355E|nr:hypothetical protein [Paenibacillus chitinolyticus]MBV6713594.1 hypothetical protein [Paenibacillus chitinolyticus]